MKHPPRIRLTLCGDGGEGFSDQRHVAVEEIVVSPLTGGENVRRIGYLLVPPEAVPQLGALGILVGLGVFSALEIVGEGAPPVLVLEPRTIRLLKIAAKVLA